MNSRSRMAVVAALALILQAGVPAVLAHGGTHSGSNDPSEANETGGQLTPDRAFADQRHPDMDGPRVVWQERHPGEEPEIVFRNLSQPNSTVPLTNNDYPDRRPVIEGHRVAWLAERGSDTNIHLLDLQTGQLHHVPDQGGDEEAPVFGGNGTLYYRVQAGGHHQLRGFDPDTGQVFKPIGERKIAGEPAAYERWLAWAEGSRVDAKLHILDTETGNVTEVPHVYTLEDGPEMGPAGLAWIAQYGGEFRRGQYTAVYNLSTGIDKKTSNVYPHTSLENCETGVIWNQPGTSTTDEPTVALWDRFVDGIITFGQNNYHGTCGDDHLVYESTTKGEDSDSQTRKLFVTNLEDVRLPRDAQIRVDPDDRRSLIRAKDTIEGTARPGDPREPIQRVGVLVDGSRTYPVNVTETEEGVAWSFTIDPRPLEPGRHQLDVTVQDDLGRTTTETFVFYTETPYAIEQAGGEDGPNVPRESSAPFPLNILNHYQDYQPFYNTVLLVLAILAAIGWFVYKRFTEKPKGRPEYVPPDEVR